MIQAAFDDLAVEWLRREIPDLVAIYRFGSTTRDAARPSSDIDYAVLAQSPIDPRRRFQLEQDLAHRLHHDVDLIDLAFASTVMRVQIVAASQPIFVADETTRAAFEMYAYANYARLNEERRPIVERIAREGSIYGR